MKLDLIITLSIACLWILIILSEELLASSEPNNKWHVGAIGAIGAVVAGGIGWFAGPLILPLLGFTSDGITPHSTGAQMMAWVYTFDIGHSLMSALQSAGIVGRLGAPEIFTLMIVGLAAGVILGYLMGSFGLTKML